MLSKKGEAAGKPLAESGDLLLGVISVIVIVGVLILLFSGDSIEELVCKISVYMADQTHDVFPIICRTFDEVIDEDQTSRVKFEIADHMRKCWSMWGEGKLNPEGKNVFAGEEFKCYKCYRLSFPEFDGTLNYNEMRDYLEDPNVQISSFNENTYINYFDNNVMFSFRDSSFLNNLVSKNRKYAITYVEHVEKSRWIRTGTASLGLGTTMGGVCIVTGFGVLLSPACFAGGAALGVLAGGIEYSTDKIEEWYKGDREKDGVMFSLYGDVENYCGGYIE